MIMSDNGDLGNGQSIVLINQHEPEGETTGRLLEIARDKGYDDSVVVAQRGEHDTALSWRVPTDVAEEFNKDRDTRWPDRTDGDYERPVAAMNEDAYAADQNRTAADNAAANAELVDDDNDPSTPKVRKDRPGKKQDQE